MGDYLAQAFREMKADRFRTRLSLLGVAVGIFSIVAALTLVDAMQRSIREGFAVYGSNILFVDRMPLEPDLDDGGHFRWWNYALRPEVSWREYRYLEQNSKSAFSGIAFARYGTERVGVAGDWRLLVSGPLAEGRGFTERELREGAPVMIVGAEIRREEGRTGNGRPPRCGESLWIKGVRYEVIGRFAKAGMNTVSTVDVDRVRLVPERTMKDEAVRCSILLADADEDAVRALMRACRRLGPGQRDDFALNRLSYLLDEMNSLFGMVAKLGWIVGIFSLLVGGFGIANILYVSVEERRPQIGICRALGAKRRVIVRQFMGEAVALSLLGGLTGILFVQILLVLLRAFLAMKGGGTDFLPLMLSPHAIVSGLSAALLIGLLFGVTPARRASLLAPVEAINK
jgi:putative ABC transport system permease protein